MIFAGLTVFFLMLAIYQKSTGKGILTTIQALLFSITCLLMFILQMRSWTPIYMLRYFFYIISLFLSLALPFVLTLVAFFIIERELKAPQNWQRKMINAGILLLLLSFLIFTIYNWLNIRSVYLPFIVSLYSNLAIMLVANFIAYLLLTLWVNFKKWNPHRSTLIIVLGTEIDEEGNVQVDLQKRLDKALGVYYGLEVAARQKSYFILTGGNPSDRGQTEAESMVEYLLDQGISQEFLIKEPSARNTRENMLFIQPFLHHLGRHKQWVIVTNQYHSLRTRYFAEKLGVRAYFVAAKNVWLSWPYSAVREYIALLLINKETMVILMTIVGIIEWLNYQSPFL